MSDSIGYCDMCRFSTIIDVERFHKTELTAYSSFEMKKTEIMVCRRYPPNPCGTNETSFFPEVNKLTWCGEYQPKRKIGDEPNAKVSS